MRFTAGPNKNEPLPLGIEIRKLLEAVGVTVLPALDPGLADRAAKIAESIKMCDMFVMFGTEDYGVDTGNTMCSYEEFKYARGLKKKIAHIKMCDAFGDGKGQSFIEMGLEGNIYKLESEGPDALVA